MTASITTKVVPGTILLDEEVRLRRWQGKFDGIHHTEIDGTIKEIPRPRHSGFIQGPKNNHGDGKAEEHDIRTAQKLTGTVNISNELA